jgi:hypothetical protein
VVLNGFIKMIIMVKRIYGTLLADTNIENRFKKLAKKIKRWIN